MPKRIAYAYNGRTRRVHGVTDGHVGPTHAMACHATSCDAMAHGVPCCATTVARARTSWLALAGSHSHSHYGRLLQSIPNGFHERIARFISEVRSVLLSQLGDRCFHNFEGSTCVLHRTQRLLEGLRVSIVCGLCPMAYARAYGLWPMPYAKAYCLCREGTSIRHW
jgi:hypothetical protein